MTTGRIKSSKTVNHASSLPEIGKIKIGDKKLSANGKEYPVSLDYFRATGNFANQFTALFGGKPNSLQIAFVSDDLNEVCNERFESWDKGKRYGWGDGETFTVWNATSAKYVEGLPASDKAVRALKWDRTLTLRFVLLKMQGILGYWTFQTKAKEVTIPSIVKSFDLVREKAGTIVGFPFNLQVEKVKSFSPGETRNYPVVKLIPNFTEESIEAVRGYIEAGGSLNRITTKMIESGTITKALGSGSVEVIEDAEVIEEGGANNG
jgi:hypothetical protein